jgi:hypothetical protein
VGAVKRKPLPPMITVPGCSTYIRLHEESRTWEWREHLVTLDEAHQLIEAPYVVVNADRFGSPSMFRSSRDWVETGWSIYALALIEDEAYAAAERAVEALRADIEAGNIRKGAHTQRVARNPLEAPVEGELRAYRERVLREMSAG